MTTWAAEAGYCERVVVFFYMDIPKRTYNNIKCIIRVLNYNILNQTDLASAAAMAINRLGYPFTSEYTFRVCLK